MLPRRVGFGLLVWVAVVAACTILTGSQSHLTVDVFGAVMIPGCFAVWLGLLVRMLAPGIFVAADRVKVRNSWWTYVLLRGDIATFERAPSATPLWRPSGTESIWVVRGDGRRIRSQISIRALRRDPWRRSAPGPKLSAAELDATVAKLNRWLVDPGA